jgi:hypothetical protein
MRKMISSWLGTLALGAGLSAPALAQAASGQPPFPLESEKAFLEAMGEKAVAVADGAWQVEVRGETLRVAFGDAGWEFDRARLREQLTALETEAFPAKAAGPSREREVQKLRDFLRAFEARNDKAAVTGTVTCSTIVYDYALDGKLVVNPVVAYAQADAKVGLQIDFGPYPDSYPDHAAGVLVTAKSSGSACVSASDYDLVDDGTYDYAVAAKIVTCGPTCLGWRTLSYVDTDCAGTYRSLTRSGGAAVCG